MSRRSVLLLAVLVILLHFSFILFMLNPLYVKSSYYRANYLEHRGIRQKPHVEWCKDLNWRSPPSSVTALVSYPGSGNTWLRYLLQQVTGILTGSVYMDNGLRLHGFPAENVTNGSVLVVKTHEVPPKASDMYKSAILLIRHPRDALLAEFHRMHKGHIGTAPKSAFQHRANGPKNSDWATYVFSELPCWETLHQRWLTSFLGPVHVVFYEVLVRDTKRTLQGILAFLNHTATEDDINCAVQNREGIYRRRVKLHNFDPFTADMYKAINAFRKRVIKLVVEFKKKNNITDRHGFPFAFEGRGQT